MKEEGLRQRQKEEMLTRMPKTAINDHQLKLGIETIVKNFSNEEEEVRFRIVLSPDKKTKIVEKIENDG